MKKYLAFVLALIFVLSLAGCNNELNGHDTSTDPDQTTNLIIKDSSNNILKAWTGEFSEENLEDAINEYQKNYDAIVFDGTGEVAYITFETDFEASECNVIHTAPIDNDDINVELNGAIYLAVKTNCDGNKISVFTDWWHSGDDWTKNYPTWSYIVSVKDNEGIEHYYYFRTDYSAYTTSSSEVEGNK